ncbi:MAG: hypothetical protein J2O48_07595, partial [Solirubrobacterales bacterium]|nr:hypothetical protein [Solirubrobacterales bacterium]
SGGSRGGTAQEIERRRLIAIAVIVVVVILLILLISSCQASNTRNSLKNYNNNVSGIINRSDQTGGEVFHALSSGSGGTTVQQDLAAPLQDASSELNDAQNLSVPGQMSKAQQNLVLAMKMRHDGIQLLANNVVQATGSSSSAARAALQQMASGTGMFWASDVIYKSYVAPAIAGALHGDNIAVGGPSNIQINPGQFVSDLGWLQTSYLATELGASAGASGGSGKNSTAPGIHGTALSTVSVGGKQLQTSGTNSVAGSPAPTFTLSVQNGGQFNQYGIKCKVSVSGGKSGTSTIQQINKGQTTTCDVKLSGTVTPGTYQVTASVSKVPGETNVSNNTQTYQVQFQ